jgi:TorA maturation chaperone TorD
MFTNICLGNKLKGNTKVNQPYSSTDKKICYQILSAFFNYPEPGLIGNLPLCLEELSSILDLPIPVELKHPPELTDLEVAYTGLFINRLGGAPAPPYGSVYMEPGAKLMGASCLRVAEKYQSEGLNLDASEEPADFLATELEFLYYLASNEENAGSCLR